ncbi:hypothetical protein LguiB_032116 [Lonicera macranthoides]
MPLIHDNSVEKDIPLYFRAGSKPSFGMESQISQFSREGQSYSDGVCWNSVVCNADCLITSKHFWRARKKRKLHLINCSTITRAEKEGGLIIREAHKASTAQLAKVGCNPALGKDHLCTSVLKGK